MYKRQIQSTSDFILQLKPSKAYIAIPTRPPAVSSVKPAGSENINMAYQIFSKKGLKTELILGFEGKNTGYTGNAENDILNISSVHPLREDAMDELLRKDNADFSTVEKLIDVYKRQRENPHSMPIWANPSDC